MIPISTKIDEHKLREWINKLPECRTFLENFFMTCGEYDIVPNFLNYIGDIELYSLNSIHIRKNSYELAKAFIDITGTKPQDFDVYFRKNLGKNYGK